ncbi:hypothetical protein ACFQ7F_04500 [Streptomyces sp. NPDC056486]|uniref:hypothetical protein n=1 Tax=Streptomyces sp. NPDC056486 TaxID=3345835 RepID=UPI00368A2EBD
MDAGLAAVLGAAVGALGTGGAAVFTSWWTATTQERQSHRQIRFEHLRERREPRSRAYAEVVAQVQKMGRQLDKVEEPDRTRDQSLDGFPQELSRLADLCARVAVEGPASIADQAQRILEQARDAFSAASGLLEVAADEIDEHEEELWRSRYATMDLNTELGRFMDLARRALDDDGSH